MQDWQRQLYALVALGRDSYGDDEVRAILGELLETIGTDPASIRPLAPLVPALGVSPCAAGWVGVLVRPSGQTTLHVGSTLAGLVEQVREQEPLGAVGLCAGPKRPEAEAWILTRPTIEVTMVAVPEVAPQLRRQALIDAGLVIPITYGGMGFVEDELLVACAVLVEGVRYWS